MVRCGADWNKLFCIVWRFLQVLHVSPSWGVLGWRQCEAVELEKNQRQSGKVRRRVCNSLCFAAVIVLTGFWMKLKAASRNNQASMQRNTYPSHCITWTKRWTNSSSGAPSYTAKNFENKLTKVRRWCPNHKAFSCCKSRSVLSTSQVNLTQCSDAENLEERIRRKLREYSEKAKSNGVLVKELYFTKFKDQKSASSYTESLTEEESKRIEKATDSWGSIQKSRCAKVA